MHSSMFGENQKAYQQKPFIPGVKDIDRRWWLGLFVCLLCKPGNLAVIEWIVKSSVYQSTIQQMWGHMLDNCSLVNVTGQICNRIAEKDVQPSAWLLRDLRRAVKNNRNNTVKHSGTKLLDNMNNIVNLITLSKLRSRSLIFSRN